MAKRSCRRTVDENKIHEQAVKIRKMTDTQIVQYISDREEHARNEGIKIGHELAITTHDCEKIKADLDIDALVQEIGTVKGIGVGKLQDIRRIIEKSVNAPID